MIWNFELVQFSDKTDLLFLRAWVFVEASGRLLMTWLRSRDGLLDAYFGDH